MLDTADKTGGAVHRWQMVVWGFRIFGSCLRISGKFVLRKMFLVFRRQAQERLGDPLRAFLLFLGLRILEISLD